MSWKDWIGSTLPWNGTEIVLFTGAIILVTLMLGMYLEGREAIDKERSVLFMVLLPCAEGFSGFAYWMDAGQQLGATIRFLGGILLGCCGLGMAAWIINKLMSWSYQLGKSHKGGAP